MKLHEEFKLYETMWDSTDTTTPAETTQIDADNYIDFDFTVIADGNQLAKLLTDSFSDIDNTQVISIIREMTEDNSTLKNSTNKLIYDLLNDVATDMTACLLRGVEPGVSDTYREIYSILERIGYDDMGVDEIWEQFIDGVKIDKFVFDGKSLYYFLDMTSADMEQRIVNDFNF